MDGLTSTKEVPILTGHGMAKLPRSPVCEAALYVTFSTSLEYLPCLILREEQMHDIEGELSFRRCTKRTRTCLVRSRQRSFIVRRYRVGRYLSTALSPFGDL